MILFGKRENTFSSISIICNLVTLFRVNYYNHPINMKNYTLNISILFLSGFTKNKLRFAVTVNPFATFSDIQLFL